MIKELYTNEKERHGFEDDWGLVIQKLNHETKKIRAKTLKMKYEGDKFVKIK